MRFLHRNRKICSRFYGGDVKSAIFCSPNPSVPLVLLLQPHVYADFTFKVKITDSSFLCGWSKKVQSTWRE